MDILAALVLLLNPKATPAQAVSAATDALERVRAQRTGTEPVPGRPRVTDADLRERILTVLRSQEAMPSMRELLVLVKGQRQRIHKVAKTMMSEGIIAVFKHGRYIGIGVVGEVK